MSFWLPHVQDMSTLIKSGTLWFSDFHKRWMTAPEALTCQGFPVDPALSYDTACCSWAHRKTHPMYSGNSGVAAHATPGRGITIGQAGNSMHTEVAATILTYALFEVSLDVNARTLFMMGTYSVLPFRVRDNGQVADDEEAQHTVYGTLAARKGINPLKRVNWWSNPLTRSRSRRRIMAPDLGEDQEGQEG